MSVYQPHDELNIRTERPLTGHDMVSAYLENNDIATCESVGAGMGGIFLRDNHEKYGITSATINIDSQACLKALASSQINSQTVLNTVLRLNEAARFLPGGLSLRSRRLTLTELSLEETTLPTRLPKLEPRH